MSVHPVSASPLWLAPEPLVLASRSAARKTLLASAGIPFTSVPADIDERAVEAALLAEGAGPAEVGLALADHKAAAVAGRWPGRLVLAADQVLALDGTLHAKPADRDAAARQLVALAGRTHHLHCAMVATRDGRTVLRSATQAAMTMRPLSADFIDRYLDAVGEAALASVGAYEYEGLGIHLFAAAEGDQSTILGLSLPPLLAVLRSEGMIAA